MTQASMKLKAITGLIVLATMMLMVSVLGEVRQDNIQKQSEDVKPKRTHAGRLFKTVNEGGCTI